MIETFEENFNKNPAASALSSQRQQLYAVAQDMVSGDTMMIDYVPGAGTTISVNGTPKVTIAGYEFMKALFTIYLGPSPAYGPLKEGMLGNK
jgi:hypothetical protein